MASAAGVSWSRLAGLLECLGEPYSGFLHSFMRLGRTADEDHLFGSSDSFMPILAVQANTETPATVGSARFLASFAAYCIFRSHNQFLVRAYPQSTRYY